jgi:ribosomal protein S3AE
VRRIRKLVTKILTEKASKSTLDNFTNEILTDSIPNTLSTEASKIFPIKATLITKVRVMKKAKIDLGKAR